MLSQKACSTALVSILTIVATCQSAASYETQLTTRYFYSTIWDATPTIPVVSTNTLVEMTTIDAHTQSMIASITEDQPVMLSSLGAKVTESIVVPVIPTSLPEIRSVTMTLTPEDSLINATRTETEILTPGSEGSTLVTITELESTMITLTQEHTFYTEIPEITLTTTIDGEIPLATTVGDDDSQSGSESNSCDCQFTVEDGVNSRSFYLSHFSSRYCQIADVTSPEEAHRISLNLCAPAFVNSWETNEYDETCLAIYPYGSGAIVPPLGGCSAKLDTLCDA